MPKRKCLACESDLTKDARSSEHILPAWLGKIVRLDGIGMEVYRHDANLHARLHRRHDIDSFRVNAVCFRCNNGWMSDLEATAKETLEDLVRLRRTVSSLDDQQNALLARWCIKTACMIGATQSQKAPSLPRIMSEIRQRRMPTDVIILATQDATLPWGMLYASREDLDEFMNPLHHVICSSIGNFVYAAIIPTAVRSRELSFLARTWSVVSPPDVVIHDKLPPPQTRIGSPSLLEPYLSSINIGVRRVSLCFAGSTTSLTRFISTGGTRGGGQDDA